MTRLFAMVLAASAFYGCASSPPMRYYTLSVVAPVSRLTAKPDAVPVRLDRVTIPGEIDRLQLVRRLDTTRLQISDQERWAAPLDEMIRRVLSADLAARLPPDLVADPNEPTGGNPRQHLSVDIQEFYADAGCNVTLKATWILRQPDKQTSQAAQEIQVASAAACRGSEGLVTGMSEAVAQLGDRLAAAIAVH